MDVLTDIWQFINQDSPKGNNTPVGGGSILLTESGNNLITENSNNITLEN